MKTIQAYTFDKVAKTITFTDISAVDITRLTIITDVTNNTIIYQFNNPLKGGTVSGNVLTLTFNTNTVAYANSDELQLFYELEMPLTPSGALLVGNSRDKVFEPFSEYPLDEFDETVKSAGDEVSLAGNSYGASYLKISKSLTDTLTTEYLSKSVHSAPFDMQLGISKSQEIFGQITTVDMVEVDDSGAIKTEGTAPTPISITGNVTVTSNVAFITLSAGHSLVPGDLVIIHGCLDNRLNYGPTQITYITKDSIGVTLVLANGTYVATGGSVLSVNPHQTAKNAYGLVLTGQNDDNIRTYSKQQASPVLVNAEIGLVTDWRTATVGGTGAGSYSQLPRGHIAIATRVEDIQMVYRAANTGGANAAVAPITTALPPPDAKYKLRISMRNLPNLTRPVAAISSIAKSASTTATVTTSAAHGLTTGNYVSIYGVRDQTNFATTNNLAVLSTPTSTTFTVAFGTSTTTTDTNGGTVFICEGSQSAPAVSMYVQSALVVSSGGFAGLLQLTMNATVSAVNRGEVYTTHGMTGTAAAYNGLRLRVYEVATTVVTLETLDKTPLTALASVNTGGTLIRHTDIRLHTLSIRDNTHHKVEIGSISAPNTDRQVMRITGNTSTSQGGGGNTTIWNAAGWGGFPVNDIASAAITTSQTSAAVAPGAVANVGTYAHLFTVLVTTITGTTPSMDVVVQESPDTGTTWFDVYHFPRITAVGSYVSKVVPSTYGSRFRYIRTVNGTTPSITNAVWRTQHSRDESFIRQFFNRTLLPNTSGSETVVYNVDGSNTIIFGGRMTTVGSPAAIIKLQGRYGTQAADWFDITDLAGNLITVTLNSTTQPVLRQISNVNVSEIKAVVSTAGTGAALDHIFIRTIGA